jgi:hypothetical protein
MSGEGTTPPVVLDKQTLALIEILIQTGVQAALAAVAVQVRRRSSIAVKAAVAAVAVREAAEAAGAAHPVSCNVPPFLAVGRAN